MRARWIVAGAIAAAVALGASSWAWFEFVSGGDPTRFRQGESTRERSDRETLGESPTEAAGCRFQGPNGLVTLKERADFLGFVSERLPAEDAKKRVRGARLPSESAGGRLEAAFVKGEGRAAVLYLLYDNGLEIVQRRPSKAPDYRAMLAAIRREQAAVPAAKNAESRLVRVRGVRGLATSPAEDAVESACGDPRLGELRLWEDGVETVILGYRLDLDRLTRIAEGMR